MRTKHLFSVGVATAVLCFLMASLTAQAAAPGYVLEGASGDDIIYTYSSVPISCIDPNLTPDSYAWTIKLAKIDDNFIVDLKNNIYILAFGNSCTPIGGVTSTIEMSWNAPTVHPVPVGPIFYADYSGAVPDFSTYNSAAELPFFETLGFHLKFNNRPGGSRVQGLAGRTGVLNVSGNASLCSYAPPATQQCFLMDLNYDDYMGKGEDLSCICATPSVQEIDLSILP